jgi:hypothetical protein
MSHSDQYESLVIAITPDYKQVTICDPATVPRIEDDPSANHRAEVCIAILNAGYEGIDLVERRLANGRYVQSISYLPDSPEGEVYEEVCRAADEGILVPVKQVLAAIKQLYIQAGGHHD